MNKLFRRYFFAALFVMSYLGLGAQSRRLIEHQVRERETVYSIAKRYNTTVDKVYELNPWAKVNIKAGDKLLLFPGATSAPRKHTVTSGETIYRISKLYDINEEQLLEANPGVSVHSLATGTVLTIPPTPAKATLDTLLSQDGIILPDTAGSLERHFVRITLMLPFRRAVRYLEFYQGFLMGLNELKKSGINIHLTALEADDAEAVERHISQGATREQDFVIGGVTEEEVRLLAQATQTGYYIVPFAGATSVSSPRLIQINRPPTELVSRVAPLLASKHREKSIVFVQRRGSADDDFVTQLKRCLKSAKTSYQTLDITSTSLSMLGSNAVVIPTAPDKALAEAVFQALGSNRAASVIGYPQWQSYGDAFLKEAHQHRTTIYSSFFFDTHAHGAKLFLTKFNAWFDKKVTDSFPKYSVLGYDVALHFIRAFVGYGEDFVEQSSHLPHDGLQMDIELERSEERQGYTNSRFYLVTFEANGSVTRQSYK